MKKIFVLLGSMFLFSGCIESIALLGPVTGAANGKVVQSSIQSGISYGIKKKTGKGPFEHVLALSKKTDKKICDTLDKEKPESCNTITKQLTSAKIIVDKKRKKVEDVKSDAKKQVALVQTKVKEIIAEKKIGFNRQFAKARKEGKDFFIFKNKIYNTTFKKSDVSKKKNKQQKSAKELAIIVQATIKEKSKIKYLD